MPGALILMGLLQSACPGAARAEKEREEKAGGERREGILVLELTNPILIAGAWGLVFPDSLPPRGEYQILYPPEPENSGTGDPGLVHLLRNGTEAGSMDRREWDDLAAETAEGGERGWVFPEENTGDEELPLLWKAFRWDRQTLLEWAQWPAGFTAGMGSAVSTVRGSKPQYQRDIGFAWDQKAFSHLLLGVAAGRRQYGGGLTRFAARSEADRDPGPVVLARDVDFWEEGTWWWAATAGVPGLKYTLSLANRTLPDYFWLDPAAARLMEERRSGRLVNQWKGASPRRKGNLAHALNARLGSLRYGIHWDLDAYAVPVQTLGFDDLPAMFGAWGAGLVLASDILATRVWLDIPDLRLDLGRPAAYPSRFRIAFLRLDLAYRTIGNFQLGASVRLHIDNPVMNAPGA